MDINNSARDLSDSTKEHIAKISAQAVHQHLYRFTITLFDSDPRSHEISSGTLIRVDDRIFIATSAHNIPQSPQTRLQILPDYRRKKEDGILYPRRAGKNRALDVGFLEVNADDIAAYFQNKVPCEIERLAIMDSGDPFDLAILMGSPEQFTEVGNPASGAPFVARLMAYASTVRSQAEWPTHPPEREANSVEDVFMDYPEECGRLDYSAPLTLTTPKGFSGGGLWSAQIRPHKLWSPDNCRLFAIQIQWDEGGRYVRATQVIHWLNLLRSKVPELKNHVEDRFPQLMAIPTIQVG